jgi:hypothetical protein
MVPASRHPIGFTRLWLNCILAASAITPEPYLVAAAVAERLQQWGTGVTAVTAALLEVMPRGMVRAVVELVAVALPGVTGRMDTLEFFIGVPTNAWRP